MLGIISKNLSEIGQILYVGEQNAEFQFQYLENS
jgi:hypothetical protein